MIHYSMKKNWEHALLGLTYCSPVHHPATVREEQYIVDLVHSCLQHRRASY